MIDAVPEMTHARPELVIALHLCLHCLPITTFPAGQATWFFISEATFQRFCLWHCRLPSIADTYRLSPARRHMAGREAFHSAKRARPSSRGSHLRRLAL